MCIVFNYVAGICEHGDEYVGSLKGREFIE
jgi:hypothetical protein